MLGSRSEPMQSNITACSTCQSANHRGDEGAIGVLGGRRSCCGRAIGVLGGGRSCCGRAIGVLGGLRSCNGCALADHCQ